MSRIELTINSGLRLHFSLRVGCDARGFSASLSNKEKIILHILNGLKWRIILPEEDYLTERRITLEAVDPGQDAVKALRALMNIGGLRREEVERLKKLPMKEVCRELALKFLVG